MSRVAGQLRPDEWCLVSQPAPTPAPLSQALAQVAKLATESRHAATAGERAVWLAGLRRLVDVAEVAFIEVLGRFDAAGDAQTLTAAGSTASWCRHELRLTGGDAAGRVRIARRRHDLAEPLERVAGGGVSFEQLRAISHAVQPLDHSPDQQQQAVEVLTDLAAAADPGLIRAAGRRLRDFVDPDGSLAERDRQFARRQLRLSPLLDGMTAVDGLLDPEATATLTAALAPLMVPAGPGDDRSSAQRRADALTEVAALALRTGDLSRLSGTPAALDVVVPLGALTDGTEPRPGSGEPRSGQPARPRSPACLDAAELFGLVVDHPGAPATLARDDVRRLACDSAIGRILLGPDSVPVDLGRRVRLFTADQRRALALRDGGCRFPGCTRPPRFTDAHHLLSWLTGGATDLDNGLLLCRHHHRTVHRDPGRGGWRVTSLDPARGANGTLVFTGPAGHRLSSAPGSGRPGCSPPRASP
jgi:hypothetical protein